MRRGREKSRGYKSPGNSWRQADHCLDTTYSAVITVGPAAAVHIEVSWKNKRKEGVAEGCTKP